MLQRKILGYVVSFGALVGAVFVLMADASRENCDIYPAFDYTYSYETTCMRADPNDTTTPADTGTVQFVVAEADSASVELRGELLTQQAHDGGLNADAVYPIYGYDDCGNSANPAAPLQNFVISMRPRLLADDTDATFPDKIYHCSDPLDLLDHTAEVNQKWLTVGAFFKCEHINVDGLITTCDLTLTAPPTP